MAFRVTERLKEATADAIVDCLYAPAIRAEFDLVFPYLTAVNIAHVLMLARQKIITRRSAGAILRAIAALARRGPRAVHLDPRLEDSYFNYEAAVISRVGVHMGGQMHTARSRNDLNVTVARLRAREALLDFLGLLLAARRTALRSARRYRDVVMTGHTHLQPAQPVTFGHYLVGVANALERDTDRIRACYAVTNRSPLGAAALAGTSYSIDRAYAAKLLGFDGLVEHTQDAVASRDFALQLLAAWTIFGVTCSRVAQDLYVWFAPEFDAVTFPDRVASTSSIMPQKKNPVVLEHLKGKSSVLVGTFAWAIAAAKNTPFTNTMDGNHEPVHALWRAHEAARICAILLDLALSTVTPNTPLLLERSRRNFCTATDLADALVRHAGLSFREAHHVVGAVVRDALKTGLSSDRITGALVGAVGRRVLGRPVRLAEETVRQALDPARAVRARATIGGPAPGEVGRMIRGAVRRLEREDAELRRKRAEHERARVYLRAEAKKMIARQ